MGYLVLGNGSKWPSLVLSPPSTTPSTQSSYYYPNSYVSGVGFDYNGNSIIKYAPGSIIAFDEEEHAVGEKYGRIDLKDGMYLQFYRRSSDETRCELYGNNNSILSYITLTRYTGSTRPAYISIIPIVLTEEYGENNKTLVIFAYSIGRKSMFSSLGEYLLALENRINELIGSPWNSVDMWSTANTTLYMTSIFFLSTYYTDKDIDSNPISPDNPYGPGGDSGEGGGGGSFDDESDIIGKPSLPTLSSANTGFTRIYNPTLSQVQDLASYLWTDDSVITTIWNHIKQFFENPMDAIIGFNLVPVPVPDGGTENFKLMYIDTGVSMTVAASQFVDIDCGTLDITPYYGSALDYSPYTKVSCFLPFIGNVSLNVDEVMGRTLHVSYRVDICSGSCVAYIEVDGNAIYQYSGHCAIPIPLSGADFSSYVNAAISVAKLAGAALTAGAGVLAGEVAGDAVQQTNQIVTTTKTVNTTRNANTGRQITTGTQTVTQTKEIPTKDQSSTEASFAGITAQNLANTVGAVMSAKPHIEHSGSFSGNSGYLGVRRPFVIIERPNMCMPANFQSFYGFPCMITLELGSCKGFTRVQQVQLTGFEKAPSNPEQAEILQLLKAGVIL